jgi:hypothetical protein
VKPKLLLAVMLTLVFGFEGRRAAWYKGESEMDLLTSLTARWTGFMTILIVVMSMRCWPMSLTSVASSAQVCRMND